MQNKSNIYTINDAAPPSYEEATGGSTSETYDPQLGQRYPDIVASWSPPVPIQSVNQEYALEIQQSEPARVILIRRTKKESQCSVLLGLIFLIVIICIVVGIGISHIH